MSFDLLRVAVLTSQKAPGLDALLRHPLRGDVFDIACLIAVEEPVPPRYAREPYDAATATVLRACGADTVLLLGYLYVLTDPMLRAFPNRILNVHDSDLSICRTDGRRLYRGLRSTRDAILSGESVTRSTVHLVTPTVDDGPIVLRSDPYPVALDAMAAAARGDIASVRRYAWLQREAMMRDWGNLAASALQAVACEVAA